MTCCSLLLEQPFNNNVNAVATMYGNRSNNLYHDDDFDFSSPSNDATWAMDKIRRMGYYHVLEQTHIVFNDANDLSTLVQRINDALQTLHCHVTSYDANSCSATAQAAGGIEFQISVWQKQQQSLVLELQRVEGDVYTFLTAYAKPLLARIQGLAPSNDDTTNDDAMAQAMDTLYQQAVDENDDDDDDFATANDKIVTETLAMVRRCLFESSQQQQQLGLETLAALTNPTVAGWDIATTAQAAVAESSDLLAVLAQLVGMQPYGVAWQVLACVQQYHGAAQ